MNHKRGKPKSGRAGCLMCKPQKHNAINDEVAVYHHGFGKIRALAASQQDLDSDFSKVIDENYWNLI